MISTDYGIDALDVLLKKDCLLDRYHPLIDGKEKLITGLKALGCLKKSDIAGIPDADLMRIGLKDPDAIGLFRRFLTLYDPDPRKFREIPALVSDPAEREAFTGLYHLPGVKYSRAKLYYLSGYRTLVMFTVTDADEILSKTARTIAENKLSCSVPLPKEARTHIAVARAFCLG
ncbi:MAG: hypothetical protein MJ070_05375 [Lachnospiraceae bacterium]|nr:hypothetical protein [Lachnospiraceae bacterium]